MGRILVLGAGMVAGPLVQWLLARGHELTVTSLVREEAEALVGGRPGGTALELDLGDRERLRELVGGSDLVVSLVPYVFHPRIARHCLDQGKHLVTASYVSPEMNALDAAARERGLVFLNELGLDPGIDHLSAMRVIDRLREQGGTVEEFRSCCGGLPAPEAVDNPFGYKFSWSPRGVLLAGRNPARYLSGGELREVPAERLFRDMRLVHVPDAGDFEAYPNRDSLVYRDVYGLDRAHTIFRGTLRNLGWCDTMHGFARLGLLDMTERPATGLTCADYVRELAGAAPGTDPRAAAARAMVVAVESLPVWNLAWLGLLDEAPVGQDAISPFDLLARCMQEKLSFAPGQRDMIVLFHRFGARFPDGRRVVATSSLVARGDERASAMARTVSLPAALGADLILGGDVRARGVLRPVLPEIYHPLLDGLAELGIVCREESRTLAANPS
ncbi:MAG: saccharopine dehydrogenase C-terminal domain-containing protein [Candidatus Krumholzibacteriia bacterium]